MFKSYLRTVGVVWPILDIDFMLNFKTRAISYFHCVQRLNVNCICCIIQKIYWCAILYSRSATCHALNIRFFLVCPIWFAHRFVVVFLASIAYDWFNRSLRDCFTLQWCNNEQVCVSNHQPQDCLLRRRSKKISKFRVTGSHEWPVTRKMLPFDDVIMIRKKGHNQPIPNHSNETHRVCRILQILLPCWHYVCLCVGIVGITR